LIVDRLTSELNAVQERAASEISELAVTVTDLKFELRNAGLQIGQLKGEVGRFSTLADERHDLLCAERRENDELRGQRIRLNAERSALDGKVARLKAELSTARANAINEAIGAMNGERLHENLDHESDKGYTLAITHCIAALESLKEKSPVSRSER
jgi:hypothetical protein